MVMEKVIITITPDGNMTVKAEGVKGSACLPLVDAITNALGGDVLEGVDTEEMFEATDSENEHEIVGGGW